MSEELQLNIIEPAKVVLIQVKQFVVNILLVLLILFIGWLVAKLIKFLVTKLLKFVESRRSLREDRIGRPVIQRRDPLHFIGIIGDSFLLAFAFDHFCYRDQRPGIAGRLMTCLTAWSCMCPI